eukprot:1142522-Pelagomonas_calceolata.AAC.5
MASQAPSLSASPLAMWLKPKIPAGRPPACGLLVDWLGDSGVCSSQGAEMRSSPSRPQPLSSSSSSKDSSWEVWSYLILFRDELRVILQLPFPFHFTASLILFRVPACLNLIPTQAPAKGVQKSA